MTRIVEVERASAEDVDHILGWLKQEYDEDGEGFWNNRQMIRDALDDPDELWVIRKDGEAVAFQLGEHAADIMSVRKDCRRMGMGQALFEASLQRAMGNDVNVFEGQCEPTGSLDFWQRMGFKRYHDPQRPHDVMVRYILPRSFDLPVDARRVPVVIGFYPEAALDDDRVFAIDEYHLEGAVLDDGSIMLDRRVLCLNGNEPEGKDLVINIEVDGKERCFGKAKHEEAQEAGVVRDGPGNAFYIDAIKSGDTPNSL